MILNNLTLKDYTKLVAGEYYDELEVFDDISDYFIDLHDAPMFEECKSTIRDGLDSSIEYFLPIYNDEIWQDAGRIRGFIAEEINELGGLIEQDLIKTLTWGIFRYHSELIYENINALLYNYTVHRLNYIYTATGNRSIHSKLSNLLPEDVDNILKDIHIDHTFSDLDRAIYSYLNI